MGTKVYIENSEFPILYCVSIARFSETIEQLQTQPWTECIFVSLVVWCLHVVHIVFLYNLTHTPIFLF